MHTSQSKNVFRFDVGYEYMKLRRKPLRGELLETYNGKQVTFIEKNDRGICRILIDEKEATINIDHLVIPIIDTRDYEKLAEDKKHHD
jgi:hypothetical protein